MRTFLHLLLLPLPSLLKVFVYRYLLRYRIGRGVRIGLSIVAAGQVEIGDHVRIGHFNYIAKMRRLSIGRHASVGHFNILMGGDAVELGEESVIARFNEINSIIDPIITNPADARLLVGKGAVITAWHKIDFTDRVEIGDSAIVAGRQSCLWTHNRQQVAPVRIGRHCYVGSGIQMVPGSSIGDHCVVGLGAVVTRPFDATYSLVAGLPAKVVKPLDEAGRRLVEYPTRPDLHPEEAARFGGNAAG